MLLHTCNALFCAWTKYNKFYITVENVEMEVSEEMFLKLIKAVRFKIVEDFSKRDQIPEPYKDRIVYGRDGEFRSIW
jgi:hypothetical protein